METWYKLYLMSNVIDSDGWKRMQAQGFFGGDAYENAPILKEFECFICKRLLRDAVLGPCCNTSFCDNCNNFDGC